MTPAEYVQLRAFARYDGLLLSFLWILSFACYIIGLSNPSISLLVFVLVAATPFFVAIRLKAFRDYGREGVISFRRGWGYVVLTFFYAALLFAMAQYVYFAYLDQGYFLQMIQKMLDSPENEQILSQYATKDAFDQMVSDMRTVRPIDLALSVLQANILIGVVLGLPIAALMRSSVKIPNNQ
jgi:hypothetical protein